nr:reverse transcriptase domain-containing protein [Tanacetum cinerariifolium]
MPDNRTMEELLQAPTEGYGEAIVIPKINADHFEIKTNLLQLVQANPYHGFKRENPHTHINNFKRITSTLKFRDVPNDMTKLMMFSYSLEGTARVWENASKMDDRIDKLEDQISTLVDIVSKKVVTPATVKAVEESYVTCGGNHAYYNCDATNSNQSSVCTATGTYNQVAPQNRASNYMTQQTVLMEQQNAFQNNLQNMLSGFFQNQTLTSGTLPSNTIPNPKGEMKAITTRSGVAYEGPSIPNKPSPKKVVERGAEETTDKEQTNFQRSTAHIQPPVVPIPEPDVSKTLPKPNIPYPSRLNDQKLREKATNQMEKFFQIFQDLHFDISFANALLLMPKFASTIKSVDKLPVIIAKDLKVDEKQALLKVLKSHKRVIAWKIFDIKGIDPRLCTHKILMVEDYNPAVQSQRRVNPKIHEVIKKEVIKLLDARMIYPISDSSWVSHIHCVPKKGGITVLENENNELIPTRLVTGWRVCIDYRKLNDATRKDHFSLPFVDQMLERLAGNKFYCFLDGFSGYLQIPISPPDQEKTTFNCPYGTFAYRRMPF